MDFRTVVSLPPRQTVLQPSSRVVLLGSCFAEHVGRHMADALPAGQVEANPFGVLYNPQSLRLGLDFLLGRPFPYAAALFQGRDGLWHSWLHSGEFSARTAEACRAGIAARLERAGRLLAEADLVVLTFGTAVCYCLAGTDQVVANCHKEPAARFRETRPDVAGTCAGWADTLAALHSLNPRAKVVFTVSPYRYAKYGFHGSQLSKAVLLLAVEQIVSATPQAAYFPAYEIVLDELRDYRFFDRDMLHPSAQAVDYVWERFRQWTFSPALEAFAAERARLLRAAAHRPLHPGSPEDCAFRERLTAQREAFRRKWGTDA